MRTRYSPSQAVFAAIVLILTMLAGQGCGANARQQALRTALTGLNAARDGFVVWDDIHQQSIVDKATSLEDGQAKLRDYRAGREKIVLGFEAAYKLLAIAALEPDVRNILTAVAALKSLYGTLRSLGVPLPGLALP